MCAIGQWCCRLFFNQMDFASGGAHDLLEPTIAGFGYFYLAQMVYHCVSERVYRYLTDRGHCTSNNVRRTCFEFVFVFLALMVYPALPRNTSTTWPIMATVRVTTYCGCVLRGVKSW